MGILPSGRIMSSQAKTYLKFGGATVVILLLLGYLCGALPWGLWLGRWVRGTSCLDCGDRCGAA